MLDHIAKKDKKKVNLTFIRDKDPRPAYLNKGYLYEQQLPLIDFGEPAVYEINNDGVMFRSPSKNSEGAKQVQRAKALQFYSTQQSSNHVIETDCLSMPWSKNIILSKTMWLRELRRRGYGCIE
ncbi:RNA-dependent RNA polymerase 1 [Hordeum vulgare]|nr:RNA-dependent RNA polymerase 1 [Hordeum vulgare]